MKFYRRHRTAPTVNENTNRSICYSRTTAERSYSV